MCAIVTKGTVEQIMSDKRLISFDEIVETFSYLDSWEERYGYVMELGAQLKPLEEHLKRDEFKVRGCASQVWMIPSYQDGHVTWQADSDALVVKGLIYLLLSFIQDRSSDDITRDAIFKAFERLELQSQLSAQRANGFASMVQRIETDMRRFRLQ